MARRNCSGVRLFSHLSQFRPPRKLILLRSSVPIDVSYFCIICISTSSFRLEGHLLVADNETRLADVDDFIDKLWKVHLAVKQEGYVQVCHHLI